MFASIEVRKSELLHVYEFFESVCLIGLIALYFKLTTKGLCM